MAIIMLGFYGCDEHNSLDPSSYDCTVKIAPQRKSLTPINCITDSSCSNKLVSGHRGTGGVLGRLAPENTIASVNSAIVLGLDFVETDPRPTIDGILVNMHDNSVDRTTDSKGLLMLMTLADIQKMKINSKKYKGDFSCSHIPTIEEILLMARGKIHVILDLNKTERVDLLLDIIRKTDAIDWAVVDTSSIEKMDMAIDIEPNIKTMLRVSNPSDFSVILKHFETHPPIIVEINDIFSTETISLAHKKNIRTFVYSPKLDFIASLLDLPLIYGFLFKQGFDIIQSDRPELVLQYLKQNPGG